ncbi:hypothetical protein N9N23_02170 [Flavobacteriaceae bacterium]|jgi:hypothetical protein|nr:hypothetical protein [Flavobacteriaceae bacterium]
MSFNSESAKAAGEKSKRGPAKVLPPSTKEMLHILYEGLLEDLIIDKKDLSNSEKIKLVQIISNYIVPKTKPIRDEATLEKIKERNSDHFTNEPDPTK